MMAVKVDDKRELRQLYAPGLEPTIVDVPEMTFLMIDGSGRSRTRPWRFRLRSRRSTPRPTG